MTDETPETEQQPEQPTQAEEATDVVETATEPEVSAEEQQPEQESEAGDEPALDIGSAAASAGTAPKRAGIVRGRLDEHGVAMGTGRRKTAVARVRISDGDGKVTINGREFKEYFPLERDQQMIQGPLRATESLGKVDVWVRVKGGGPTGQTGAVLLGIARALQVRDPHLHEKLSEGGYLTRDGRMVERKKYGLRKARRSFQFSKR